MCPQCDKVCTYWNLTITCESSKVTTFTAYTRTIELQVHVLQYYV